MNNALSLHSAMQRALKPALASFLLFISSAHAAPPAGSPAEDHLPNDTLTLTQAKAFLHDYETERDQIQEARKAIFARGANATPEERAKLIEEFQANYGARMKAQHANAARAEELGSKVQKAEKTNAAAGPR
jgi:hypothetical protein